MDKALRPSQRGCEHDSERDLPQMMRWERLCNFSSFKEFVVENPIGRGAQYSKRNLAKELKTRIISSLDRESYAELSKHTDVLRRKRWCH